MATGDARARRRKVRRRRGVMAAAGLAVVAGASVPTAAAINGAEPRWRVSDVTTGSVTQTIESSGTVSAANKVTPSFSVSGTVNSVAVKVGQTVSTGDTLATLDTTALQSNLDSAKSALASARQKLEADKTGQTSVGGTSITHSSYNGSAVTVTDAVATTTATIVMADVTDTGSNDALQAVRDAQDAVISAQTNVDSGQKAVDSAQQPVDDDIKVNLQLSQAQKAACGTSGGSTDGSGSDQSSTDSSTDSTQGASNVSTACTEAQANYEASASRLAADMTMLDNAIDAQDQHVANLDHAISTLDAAITTLRGTSTGSSGGTGGTGGGGVTGGTGGGSTGGTGGGSGGSGGPSQSGSGAPTQSGNAPSTAKPSGGSTQTTQPASAAQLAADQAAIDAAEANVTEAEQNLAAATLTSPISGKIAAIGFTPGESSSGADITVVGVGVQKVSTTVPLSHIDLVHRGESVTVAADGVAPKLHGTVTSIGMLSTTTGTTTSFPVTITLDEEQANLYDGTGADVVITTGTAKNAVTVPNSALHAGPRGTYTVTVIKNGTTTTKSVTLGVAGSEVTEVKSGLSVGDQVVLADLTEVLPSSSTSSTNTGRNGGFVGGFLPGGFVGGR